MEEVTFNEFEPKLPISKIDIAEENVRKNERNAGLEDLKASIEKLGLIHPVLVIETNGRFKLIAGQRRLLAFKALGRTNIPALIINPVNSRSKTIISFGENLHRRDLSYSDTIRICESLFNEYKRKEKDIDIIRQISLDLGLTTETIKRYLSYQLVPNEVRDIVDKGGLSQKVASRITSSFWPNEKKIIDIANKATRLTKPEKVRLGEITNEFADATPEEIIEESKKPALDIEIWIKISVETKKLLDKEAEIRKTDYKEIINLAINKFLGEER